MRFCTTGVILRSGNVNKNTNGEILASSVEVGLYLKPKGPCNRLVITDAIAHVTDIVLQSHRDCLLLLGQFSFLQHV